MITSSLYQQLFDVVSAVPGVVAVYPTHSALRALTESVVATVTRREPTGPVLIEESDEGLRIAVTLGITDESSAAQTCRAAYDVLHAHVVRSGETVAGIRILIANVQAADTPLLAG